MNSARFKGWKIYGFESIFNRFGGYNLGWKDILAWGELPRFPTCLPSSERFHYAGRYEWETCSRGAKRVLGWVLMIASYRIGVNQ